MQGCRVLTLALSPAPLVLSLSFPTYKRATLLGFAKCVSVPDASTPRSKPAVPLTSGGTELRQDWAGGMGSRGRALGQRRRQRLVRRLRSADSGRGEPPRDRPGPRVRTGKHWRCPCQAVRRASQEDLSLFFPRQSKGRGKGTWKWFQPKEPRGDVGQKVQRGHCKRSQSMLVLRPHGTSRRRAEGHLGRDRMGATGSGTPGAKETTEKPPEELGSSAQGLRQGAARPPLRATGRGDWGSTHRAFGCWCFTRPPGSMAGEACVWEAIPPPPPQTSAPH